MIARFLSYWASYVPLQDRHGQWLQVHGKPLPNVPLGATLHDRERKDNRLFFVDTGLLGGVSWDENGHRSIHLLAPPTYNLMATRNFYTDKRVPYEIVALRSSAVLQLPVEALRAFREQDAAAAELVCVLREKHNKQYLLHNALLQIRNEGDRYRAFECYCKEWLTLLTLQEIADYLGLSLSSVNRARRGDI